MEQTPEEKENERLAKIEFARLKRRIPNEDELSAMDKPFCPGFIVIGRRKTGGNSFELGTIECSFSMDTDTTRTQFNWSSENATSNLGDRFKVDGRKHAEEDKQRLDKNMPDYEWFVYDVHDPELPVLIDWDEWRAANAPAWTLSGVIDKFSARNVRFFMKN